MVTNFESPPSFAKNYVRNFRFLRWPQIATQILESKLFFGQKDCKFRLCQISYKLVIYMDIIGQDKVELNKIKKKNLCDSNKIFIKNQNSYIETIMFILLLTIVLWSAVLRPNFRDHSNYPTVNGTSCKRCHEHI